MSRRDRKRLNAKRRQTTTREKAVRARNRRRKIATKRYMMQLQKKMSVVSNRPGSEDEFTIINWEKFEVLYEESSAMLLENSKNINALLTHPDLPESVHGSEEAIFLLNTLNVSFVKLSKTLHKIGLTHDMKQGAIQPGSDDEQLAKDCYNMYAKFDEVLLNIMARVADATVVVISKAFNQENQPADDEQEIELTATPGVMGDDLHV